MGYSPEMAHEVPVNTEEMDKQVKMVLEQEIKDPAIREQTFADIKRTLDESTDMDDFVGRYKKIFDRPNDLMDKARNSEKDYALRRIESAIVPIFSEHFANKNRRTS